MKRPITIAELEADPENRRTHPARNVAMITAALREVGAARSIVLDEHDRILAGNGVVTAAREAGISKLTIVEADGDELVAVRRRGLTDAQKRALAIYDNRTGELAEWNVEQLTADRDAGLALEPFWTADEQAVIFAASGGTPGRTDPDEVPAERPTSIVHGDLFALGRHRVLCGDAYEAEHVARVNTATMAAILADPPYGIDLDTDYSWMKSKMPGKHQGRTYPRVHGDAAPFDARRVRDLITAKEEFWFGADHYIRTLPDGGSWLVWDKRESADADRGFGSAFELCWSRQAHKRTFLRYRWFGFFTSGADASEQINRLHPTQKPTAMLAQILEQHTEGLNIFDPFLGSGSTLIACARLGRTCYGLEYAPAYVQIIIDRWEAFTGKKAEKLGEVAPARGKRRRARS